MQEMNQDQMVQGLQAKVSQLDILLHEALQEKMELKQQYGQMQGSINATMQSLAGKVAETRKFIDENVKDKKSGCGHHRAVRRKLRPIQARRPECRGHRPRGLR